MSFKESRELEQLPQKIESLEAEQASLNELIARPDFFAGPQAEVQRVTRRLADIETELLGLFERWEELESVQS